MVFTWDVEALLSFQLQMMNPLVRTNEQECYLIMDTNFFISLCQRLTQLRYS